MKYNIFIDFLYIINMKTLILHSHLLDEHAEAGKEFKARLDEWAELLIRSQVDNILITWWIATPWVPKMHSEVGLEYLHSQGISKTQLYAETLGSLETVGEFVFAREEYDDELLNVSDELIHLSSDYHIPRMQRIAQVIWWNEKKLRFHSVPWFHRNAALEEKSTQAFHSTFSGVTPWNLQELLHRLWQKHPLYTDHPNNPLK